MEIQPQFLSFDSSLNQLTLLATDKSDVGIYLVEVWVKLIDYGTIYQLL